MKTSIVFALLFVGLTQANKLSYSKVDNGGIVGVITAPTSEDIDVEINLPANVEVLGTFSGATHASKQNSQVQLADNMPKKYKSVQSANNNLIKDTANSLHGTLEKFAVKAFNLGVRYGVNLEQKDQKQKHKNRSSEYKAKIKELEDQQDIVAVQSFSYGVAIGLEVGSQAASESSTLKDQKISSVKKHLHPSLSKFVEARNAIIQKLSLSEPPSSKNLSSKQSKSVQTNKQSE